MSDTRTNTPKIRFSGFTEDWEQRKLGELTKTTIGEFVIRSKQNLTGHYPVYNGGKTYTGFYDEYNNESNKIVISARGANAGFINLIKTKYWAGNSCYSIEIINKKDINLDYLYQFMKNRQHLFTDYQQAANIPSVSKKDVETFNILLPVFNEQQKIGTFFKQLDDTIALHQRELDLLKQTKQTYLQKMFPKSGENKPEIRFAGFTEDWEQRKLGDMGETFTGLSGKSKEDFGHGNAKFVTYVNVFGNPIANPKMVESVEVDAKQNQVKYGDVFFTTSSETPEEVGMSSLWLEDAENVYLNSFCFGYRPLVDINSYYLAIMLRSPLIRKNFMLLAQGISRYNISKTKVMEMEVPIPNLKEQQKIGNFFKQLDDTIALHQRKLDSLKEMKKSLLQQMFV